MLQYCQCIYVSLAHVHACFLMPWIAPLFLYSTSLLTQVILPQKNWVCSPPCSKSPANIWKSCIAVFLDFWFYNGPGIPITGWLILLSWNILSLDWSFWFLQSPSCLNCYSPIYKHYVLCVYLISMWLSLVPTPLLEVIAFQIMLPRLYQSTSVQQETTLLPLYSYITLRKWPLFKAWPLFSSISTYILWKF